MINPNVKLWSDMILVLPSMMIKLSIVRKKKQDTTECDKSAVRSNIGTPQCNNGTVKFENKKQGTTERDKNRVRYDVSTTECDNWVWQFLPDPRVPGPTQP